MEKQRICKRQVEGNKNEKKKKMMEKKKEEKEKKMVITIMTRKRVYAKTEEGENNGERKEGRR